MLLRTKITGGGGLAVCTLIASVVFADDRVANTPAKDRPLDEVTIIGHRRETSDLPGSAHVIDQEDLETFLQSDVMRVLRTVPGVYLQDEDGFGLRPNIGIRGSGLDRSARIALLEDGVLIAPAPYAAPSAYYFPTQRRMNAIEVLKGPSSIAVGPKTTGGAVNLISTPIPNEFAGLADIRVGQNDSLDAHLYLGNRGKRFSWLAESVQARSDGFKSIDGPLGASDGRTGYDIQDYVVKLQFDSDPNSSVYQSLRLKAGSTDQTSDETYLGLTSDDFLENPTRRYAASAADVFRGEHEQLQMSYVIEPESDWRGEITIYRNNFARDWFKLQSVNGAGISSVLRDTESYATEFSYLTGASDSPDDAIVNRHNNREYFSQGVQAKLSWDVELGAAEIALTAGVRVHEDEEDRFQSEDGFRMEGLSLIPTSVGQPGSTTNRVSGATATSYFIDTEIRTGKWIFTPGMRFEDVNLDRQDFSTADPSRSQGPTRVRENSVSVLIPGFGALYELNDNWKLLGGIHKGFNPPAPGSTAGEEDSINVELGMRFHDGELRFEAIYFLNDYDNLVGTVTASTGGDGQIGDQFDGGEVTVQGLELSSSYDATLGRHAIPLALQYTWTAEAEFKSAFDSGFDPWGNVEVGDDLPYIPEHQLRATAGITADSWGINLAASYVGKMRAVAGQGVFTPESTVDSHVVWDLIARMRWSDSISTYVKVDNLFDETYVASLRPSGVRPGLDRTVYLGMTLEL